MKQEMLRLDRVTCIDHGEMELNQFCLDVYAGEILGLLLVNGTGVQHLMRLLRQNLPIHYGYVYYREKLVNDWRHSDGSYNRVGIIQSRSGLADDLTVSDNVFVLRSGFRKRLISRGVLKQQLQPFLDEIGVELSADAQVRELSAFQRYVVELVKAVVAGCRLVVLMDAGTTISEAELHTLHNILRHYSEQGISFVYVSQHYEEVRSLCARAALMMNGQIVKILDCAHVEPEALSNSYGIERFDRMVRQQERTRVQQINAVPAVQLIGLKDARIQGLDMAIAPGECVVVQDLDNRIIDDLVNILSFHCEPNAGKILVDGLPVKQRRDIAVIQKLATKSMLFPDLSYLDNLCFTMDHRIGRFWMRKSPKGSIQEEYGVWLGDVFDADVEELSISQKYDLIYARVLLQRPRVVFCVQPFMQADLEQRIHIWTLLERLLDKGIAVVLLAVNLADTLSVADRLVRIKDGRVLDEYQRDQFGTLPENIPWRYLWNIDN